MGNGLAQLYEAGSEWDSLNDWYDKPTQGYLRGKQAQGTDQYGLLRLLHQLLGMNEQTTMYNQRQRTQEQLHQQMLQQQENLLGPNVWGVNRMPMQPGMQRLGKWM